MKGVTRVTVSIPEDTYEELEKLIELGKWKNRSQIITQLINDEYIQQATEQQDSIMAGSLTLFYDESQREILEKVTQIQRENIDQVISSNRILLENNHIMEILLVQGKVRKLKEIQNQLLSTKGVKSGKLALTNIILPPIQSK